MVCVEKVIEDMLVCALYSYTLAKIQQVKASSMSKRYSKGYNSRYSNFQPSEVKVPSYRGKTLQVPNTGLNVQVYNINTEMFVKLHKPRSEREISLRMPEFTQLTAPLALQRIQKEIEMCSDHVKKYHPEGPSSDNYMAEEVEELPTFPTEEKEVEAKKRKLDTHTT